MKSAKWREDGVPDAFALLPSKQVADSDANTEPDDPELALYQAALRRHASSGAAFVDEDFPATHASVRGEEPSQADKEERVIAIDVTPRCRCGTDAAKSTVKLDTPNKGREYWRCAQRKCGHFAWVDGGERQAASWSKIGWTRLPALDVVSDFGFRAQDLRQGGVGDCWFMSALSVVAERHDLIARLFVDTARSAAGCYALRFFLDGAWTTVVLDDQLPVTEQPRRPELAFGAKLAFCRCTSHTGAQQLWASLVEKGYAKAHGSYRAISGGEIAEALLDLTGCPTLTLDLDAHHFRFEQLWPTLVACRALGLPMGCATAPEPNLREVGLVGCHAYSILDVREVRTADGRDVRLVRVRNPHGVGEWTGEWSDSSRAWADVVAAAGLERTGVDDGTFWMDVTHFMMGFSIVDVCLAHRGWHARSFANAFPERKSACRLCACAYLVRAQRPATLHVLALQPTRRGHWCRKDRRRSYRLGDLSVLIGRLDREGRRVETLVGGSLRGAERGQRAFSCALDDPTATYVVLPICLANSPTAAESKQRAPFRVRFFASEPLRVTPVGATEPAAPARAREREAIERIAAHALHLAATGAAGFGGGARGGARSSTCALETLVEANQRELRPRSRALARGVSIATADGDGAALITALNARAAEPALVEVTVYAKSHAARGADGLLSSDKPLAQAYEAKLAAAAAAKGGGGGSGGGGGGGGFKWPAKWAAYRTVAHVPPRSQRALIALAQSGVQARFGEVEVRLLQGAEATAAAAGGGAGVRAAKPTPLDAWLGAPRPPAASPDEPARPSARPAGGASGAGAGGRGGASAAGSSSAAVAHGTGSFFDPVPLLPEALVADAHAPMDLSGPGGAAHEPDAELKAALAASLREHERATADAELERALAASLHEAARATRAGRSARAPEVISLDDDEPAGARARARKALEKQEEVIVLDDSSDDGDEAMIAQSAVTSGNRRADPPEQQSGARPMGTGCDGTQRAAAPAATAPTEASGLDQGNLTAHELREARLRFFEGNANQ